RGWRGGLEGLRRQRAAGSTYLVRVRASRDGGDTWCEWGWTCPVTIDQVVSVPDRDRVPAHDLRLWPNPNSTGGGWRSMGSSARPSPSGWRSMTCALSRWWAGNWRGGPEPSIWTSAGLQPGP